MAAFIGTKSRIVGSTRGMTWRMERPFARHLKMSEPMLLNNLAYQFGLSASGDKVFQPRDFLRSHSSSSMKNTLKTYPASIGCVATRIRRRCFFLRNSKPAARKPPRCQPRRSIEIASRESAQLPFTPCINDDV